ncbi:uncharacterized protein [Diadema setosum]|uniref:uncharacterized protein n=1 Tax=Diadema setosum TaxID=31175 RepID=UPI003B3B16CA
MNSSSKAEDFYHLFRSSNTTELRKNLPRIANNRDLDRQDLALLVLLLTNMPQPQIRRLVRGTPACSQALQDVLDRVVANEGARGARPYDADVREIETILYGPPLSPDIP